MTYWSKADFIPIIRDLIDEAWEAETPEQEACYPKYMNVGNFNRGEFVDIQVSGLGMPIERQVLEDIDYDTYDIGPELRVLPLNYGRGFRMAVEDQDDIMDSGPWDGRNAALLGSYQDVVKRWKRSATVRVETACAAKILNGTTAGAYAGRDGLALLTTHTTLKNPPQSQGNVTTGSSVSQANIYTAITALDTQLDDRGDFIENTGGYILLYAPTNWARVGEVLKTDRQVDTHNWNTNLLKDQDITPVACKYLGASYAGWWLISKKRNPLWWRWRQKPKYDQNEDFDANAVKYKMTMRGVTYHRDWRGIAGFPTS